MKKYIVFVILFTTTNLILGIYFSSLSYAYADGEMWNKIDAANKFTYVAGYRLGEKGGIAIKSIYRNKTDQELKTEKIVTDRNAVFCNADIQQIISGIDQFYSEYANIHLPINIAFFIVVSKIQGVPEEKLQKDVEQYRKDMANAITDQ